MSSDFPSTDAEKRPIEHHAIVWRGIAVTVVFSPDSWSGDSQLEIIAEPRTPLPITETGYLFHFLHEGEIEEAGGPVAFVMRWLDVASKSPKWRAAYAASRQGNLF
jgi:hypothetical protein